MSTSVSLLSALESERTMTMYRFDPMTTLPETTVISHVCEYLTLAELSNCCAVSKLWNSVISDLPMWRQRCTKYGYLTEDNRGFKKTCLNLEPRLLGLNKLDLTEWNEEVSSGPLVSIDRDTFGIGEF